MNESGEKKAKNTLRISKLAKDKEKKSKGEKKLFVKNCFSDEYKKKVTDLRQKVNSLQKERNTLLDQVAKQRAKARTELLKNLNPIIQDYMKKNNIRMVVDKKSLLLADEKLNITEEIMSLLNKKIKSINLK